MSSGRQIVEDQTIEHEVDEEQIRQMTAAAPDAAWFSSDAGDRGVAPGVNAPLLQVNNK